MKLHNMHFAKSFSFAFNRNFPNVIGAIDGCHIRIAPRKSEQIMHYNFKRFQSIHFQAVCSYDRKFMYIFVGCVTKYFLMKDILTKA